MKQSTTSINLIREKQQFQASIALIQGTLKDLSLQLHQLHPKEKSTYDSYQYKIRKTSYLLGRLSTKQAIMKLTEINHPTTIWTDAGVFQFPVVKCPYIQNIQVSISHCDDIGLSIAFPEAHPMGIDLEKISADRAATLSSQLTDNEKFLLKRTNQNHIAGYTSFFSIKEALSKVLKTGMMLDFNFLEIDGITSHQEKMECTFTHFGQYKAFSVVKGKYVVALVLPKRTKLEIEQVWKVLDSLKEPY